ncbi:hypothetical protein [Mangrovibacter yixingensis]|uniref:hypothetical protein n=1 Tax=Mangrovibacter yixingensis TaxID=1529639 RepID=UPI001CFAE35E|nr:hypothetical protein [Mangrovibacter yixingensis]
MTDNRTHHPRVNLRLSRSVSNAILGDIKALLPNEGIHIFINELDDENYATLECNQNDTLAALLVPIIVVWRQLGYIGSIVWHSGKINRDVTTATQFQLLSLMKTPLPLFVIREA